MNEKLSLRDVIPQDLPEFFKQQNVPEAIKMAAFPPRKYGAFMEHWNKILKNNNVLKRTILYDNRIAGNIVSFNMSEDREVGYWFGKEFWGLGIATQALKEYIQIEKHRPLYAHVAGHNKASFRVLEKCGFQLIGPDEKFFDETEEKISGFILELKE